MTNDRFAERRHIVAEDRARRALRRTVTILGFAAIVAGVVYLFHSPLLSVQRLEVEGAEHSDVAPVLVHSGISVGEPLIWTDVDQASSDLVVDPWIESVEVARDWPDRVVVIVTERTPVAAIGQSAVALDGVTLPGAELTGLPTIAIEAVPVDGRYPQQEILGALRFFAALRSDLAVGASIATRPEGLVAGVGGYTVRLGRPVDMEQKARALAPVLDEAPVPGSEITLIAPSRPAILAPGSSNPQPEDEG